MKPRSNLRPSTTCTHTDGAEDTHDANLQAVLESMSILDGQHTIAAHAAHSVGNELADGDIAIGGDGGDL